MQISCGLTIGTGKWFWGALVWDLLGFGKGGEGVLGVADGWIGVVLFFMAGFGVEMVIFREEVW